MPKTVPDPPVADVDVPIRPDFVEPVEPMPAELEQRLDQIEEQNLNAQGTLEERPYALPGEDEGPLGEGGQLREPDAGSGSS